MIAVIADDLTGAAELGGIGLRYGLVTEVCVSVPVSCDASLLVIATDTRSMSFSDAVAEMSRVTSEVARLAPEWIYKKVDSVLRGHVVREIEAQLRVLGFKRALLAPANPFLGRTIYEGKYFINGQPIHLSAFAKDPEYPVVSSDVRDMLGDPSVKILSVGDELREDGIVVGEVQESGDLYDWAGRVDSGMLPAGGAGFFEALLRWRGTGGKVKLCMEEWERPVLVVSGTAFRMNADLLSVEEIVRLLREQGVARIGTGPVTGEAPFVVKERMAKLVAAVLSEVPVGELIIEGGATAYAILLEAGLHTFFPVEELAPGVVRMRTENFYVTVKPGSYPWPDKFNILPI